MVRHSPEVRATILAEHDAPKRLGNRPSNENIALQKMLLKLNCVFQDCQEDVTATIILFKALQVLAAIVNIVPIV